MIEMIDDYSDDPEAPVMVAPPSPTASPPFTAPRRILDRLWPLRRGEAGRAAESEQVVKPVATVLYTGVPSFTDGQAVLFDSTVGRIPESATITRLEVRFPGGTPANDALDPGLEFLIFVDDLSLPRARVRLADVMRQGGVRPLNLSKASGQVVRIVLADPAGAWGEGSPEIEVAMGW